MRPLPDRARDRLHSQERARRAIVFSGRSHRAFAAAVAAELGTRLGAVELARRPGGETHARYAQTVRGAAVFVVQSCARPTNDHLMELLVMVQAARYASAGTVTAVIPWYPYGRQDRVDAGGEPLSARLVSDLLGAAGVDAALTVDLHASQIQAFVQFPVHHVSAFPLLSRTVAGATPGGQLVIVSPDAGRLDAARKAAGLLGGAVALIRKERPEQQAARAVGLVGDVEGKTCVVLDDMIDAAGTLCAAGDTLREHGAERVWACATHAVLSPPACERLAASVFERIVVTDTLPIEESQRPPALEVVSVAPMLATAIRAIVGQESLSARLGAGHL
jgi:ribose-phosphate pyrophosphokinase